MPSISSTLWAKKSLLKTKEPRSKSFLKQRLSMAIQRGSGAAIMGTFRSCDKDGRNFLLADNDNDFLYKCLNV